MSLYIKESIERVINHLRSPSQEKRSISTTKERCRDTNRWVARIVGFPFVLGATKTSISLGKDTPLPWWRGTHLKAVLCEEEVSDEINKAPMPCWFLLLITALSLYGGHVDSKCLCWSQFPVLARARFPANTESKLTTTYLNYLISSFLTTITVIIAIIKYHQHNTFHQPILNLMFVKFENVSPTNNYWKCSICQRIITVEATVWKPSKAKLLLWEGSFCGVDLSVD